MLGLKAGGNAMTLADFHNPGRVAQIGIDMFGRTTALGAGMNIITDFITLTTIYIAAVFVTLGFFLLALQLFVTLIAFKLGSLAAFVALPWGVFNGTAWVAERPLGWVAGSAVRLFMLAFVASVTMTFVATLPRSFVLADGAALQVLFFGLTVALLAWFAPMLASEVMAGQPHLSGQDAVRTATNTATTVIGATYLGGAAAVAAGKFGVSTMRAIAGRSGARSGGNGGGGGARAAAPNYAAMKPKPAASSRKPAPNAQKPSSETKP